MSLFQKKRTRRREALFYLSIAALLLLTLNVLFARGKVLPGQAARLTEQQLGAWEKPDTVESRWAEDEFARLYLRANERAVFFSYVFPDWRGWNGVGMVLDCTQSARVHLADGALLPADDLFEGWSDDMIEHFSRYADDYAVTADSLSIGDAVDVLYSYSRYDALRGYVFGRVDDPAVHELRLLAPDGTVCLTVGGDELVEHEGYRYFLLSHTENTQRAHTLALYDAFGVLLEQISVQ